MKWWILALGFALVIGCGDPGDDGSGSCVSGETVSCVCSDGQSGTGTCSTGGTVASCFCQPGAGTPCTNGAVQICTTFCNSQGTSICTNGVFGTCIPPAETANGIDDNCDGNIDENTGAAVECTLGQTDTCITSCTSIGTKTCGSTGQWAQCLPPEEECNGKDDDCDGKIDDGMQRNCQTACGTGTEVCTNGTWQACSAATPETEVCDGLDNDCDGKTDLAANGTPLQETCDEGCGVGSRSCINATWGPCSAVPDPEVCDGLDNDCNGTTDDPPGGCDCIQGEEQACGKSEGECNPGVQQCISGQWTECGGTNFQGQSEEQCNGLDDDCDGMTDEGNPDGGSACGTPNETQGGEPGLVLPCQIGLMSCLNGQLQCVGGVDPGPELCDGIDNDCNGLVDDDPQGDQWEPNQSCETHSELGYVVENQGPSTFQGNLFPGSDVDWFLITAREASNFCFGGEEGPYTLTITLKPPSLGGGAEADLDYDLCVYPVDSNSCEDLGAYDLCDFNSPNNLEIFKGAGTAETWVSESWMGECFENDDRDFYVQVVTYDPEDDFSCDPYTLEIQHSSE